MLQNVGRRTLVLNGKEVLSGQQGCYLRLLPVLLIAFQRACTCIVCDTDQKGKVLLTANMHLCARLCSPQDPMCRGQATLDPNWFTNTRHA